MGCSLHDIVCDVAFCNQEGTIASFTTQGWETFTSIDTFLSCMTHTAKFLVAMGMYIFFPHMSPHTMNRTYESQVLNMALLPAVLPWHCEHLRQANCLSSIAIAFMKCKL